ncbi:hypothetical protein SCP_0500650 [Sparassis crispa]|uniref:TPR-like protein n=1 Tax=Sparassis crispa TaxID=139825 RepID=A0A401GLI9_9APHY|nr:hypothetical protein SCP_0500650 [Sparassis crispa]GBE83022.1 hypothetical protein SCP_0500650 [Sparassis crispa]
MPPLYSLEELTALADMNISDTEEEALKELGNDAFRVRDFRGAIKLYTLALQNLPDSPANLEARRILLANRGQTYHLFGDLYTALRDIDMALSPRYTRPDSPRILTTKCRFRRAKLLFTFARYDEAKVDFDTFVNLMDALDISLDDAETDLGKSIDTGVSAPKSGQRYKNEQLMRAIDARGLVLKPFNRLNFPRGSTDLLFGPPVSDEDPILTFYTRRGTEFPSDMTQASIAYPLSITAPYFKARPDQGDEPYLMHPEDPYPDDVQLSWFMDNLFKSAMVMFPSHLFSDAEHRRCVYGALDHDDPRHSVVMVHTARGRMLIVPRTATLKQIIEGSRWPRDDPLPFEDRRQQPRRRDDPIDGIELGRGGSIELYVIPNEKLSHHVEYHEKCFKFVKVE